MACLSFLAVIFCLYSPEPVLNEVEVKAIQVKALRAFGKAFIGVIKLSKEIIESIFNCLIAQAGFE